MLYESNKDWIKLLPQSCDISPQPYVTLNPQFNSGSVSVKVEGCGDLHFEQHAIIEFLTVGKNPPINIHRYMQAVNGDEHVEISTVRHWVLQFKQEVGEASLCGKAKLGRPRTRTNKSHRECIEEMISTEVGGDYV